MSSDKAGFLYNNTIKQPASIKSSAFDDGLINSCDDTTLLPVKRTYCDSPYIGAVHIYIFQAESSTVFLSQ